MINKIRWELNDEREVYEDNDSIEGIIKKSGSFRTLLLASGFYKGRELYILEEKSIERPELIEEINRCAYILKSTRKWDAVCNNNKINPDEYVINEKFAHTANTAEARLAAYRKVVEFAENDLHRKISIIAERKQMDYDRV